MDDLRIAVKKMKERQWEEEGSYEEVSLDTPAGRLCFYDRCLVNYYSS